ncbi:MAG: hypothetical protein ACREQZ_10100 [Woeseiaceae bacterium]
MRKSASMQSRPPDLSRVWSESDQAAGVVPIAVLRFNLSRVLRVVQFDRRELVVLRRGRSVVRLVPFA